MVGDVSKRMLAAFLATGFAAPLSEASDFRFCDLEGTILATTPALQGAGPMHHQLSVEVDSAVPEQRRRPPRRGYTDCSEFIGTTVEAGMRIPERYGAPVPGDRVAFSYALVDVVDGQGQWVTTVEVEFHDYWRALQE